MRSKDPRIPAFLWDAVLKETGGVSALARLLGVSRQAVSKNAELKQMPIQWAVTIHKATNGRVSAPALRPDVYEGICQCECAA